MIICVYISVDLDYKKSFQQLILRKCNNYNIHKCLINVIHIQYNI